MTLFENGSNWSAQARPDNKYTFSMGIGSQSDLSAVALAEVEALTKQEKLPMSPVFVILTEVIFEKGYTKTMFLVK